LDRRFDLKVAVYFLDWVSIVSYNGRLLIVTRIERVLLVMSLILLASRAAASPIGPAEWTGQTFSLQAAPISVDSTPGAVQSLRDLSAVVAPLERTRVRVAVADLTTILGLDRLSLRLTGDPRALLVRSVAVPTYPAFQEPSAWVIALIGLGIVALGSARLRRRAPRPTTCGVR
jgi:hypothetical protein